eukprot:3841903-Rhodomonas_salina.1
MEHDATAMANAATDDHTHKVVTAGAAVSFLHDQQQRRTDNLLQLDPLTTPNPLDFYRAHHHTRAPKRQRIGNSIDQIHPGLRRCRDQTFGLLV